MPVNLCAECYVLDYCRRLTSEVVTAEDLTPAFVADLRRFMQALDLGRDRWAPFVLDLYRDYPGRIVDANGAEVELDTEVFAKKSIAYWFRDMCRPVPVGYQPHVYGPVKTRIIVLASILRAAYSVQAKLWGKVVANDAGVQIQTVIRPNASRCPYPRLTMDQNN